MLLWNCKWGLPVSGIVLTLSDRFGLTEEKTLRLSLGRDANGNTMADLVDDVSSDGASCCCEYLLVSVCHDGLQLL